MIWLPINEFINKNIIRINNLERNSSKLNGQANSIYKFKQFILVINLCIYGKRQLDIGFKSILIFSKCIQYKVNQINAKWE